MKRRNDEDEDGGGTEDRPTAIEVTAPQKAVPAATRVTIAPPAPTLAPPAVKPAPASGVAHYRVTRGAKFVQDGMICHLEAGAVINTVTHDLATLEGMGVQVEPCGPPGRFNSSQ